MSKEKFLLVSLNESKTKHVAQVISNQTCRKILDYLADKEATETKLSKELDIPISTIHYNLEQLQKAGLVIVEEFHYSEKGREVGHYKLANKYIIIAPKSTYGIKEKLRNILPVAIIIAAGAGLISFFSRFSSINKLSSVSRFSGERIVEESAEKALQAVPALVQDNLDNISNVSSIYQISSHSIFTNIALWFLIGAVLALISYFVIDWLRDKKSKI